METPTILYRGGILIRALRWHVVTLLGHLVKAIQGQSNKIEPKSITKLIDIPVFGGDDKPNRA